MRRSSLFAVLGTRGSEAQFFPRMAQRQMQEVLSVVVRGKARRCLHEYLPSNPWTPELRGDFGSLHQVLSLLAVGSSAFRERRDSRRMTAAANQRSEVIPSHQEGVKGQSVSAG